MAEGAIAADREKGRASLVELGGDLTQAGELRRSDAAEVIAVEPEDDVAAAVFAKRDRPALGARQIEVRCGLSPPQRHDDAHSGDFRPASQPPRRPPRPAALQESGASSPCEKTVQPVTLDHDAVLGSTHADVSVVSEIRSFLRKVADDFQPGQPSRAEIESPQTIAESVFAILTRRQFTYLSKSRAGTYRASILGHLAEDAHAGRPLRFSYDIGGGYRAGIDASRRDLSFSPGLGELFALRQITLLDRQIRAVYAPGATFSLVVDNVCALLVNDIPLHRTSSYCNELRNMVGRLNLEGQVDLLVESEHFRPEDYCVDTSSVSRSSPSPDDRENVSRFLGRDCEPSEMVERIARYQVVSDETEKRFRSIASGVRMTQRATPSTFGFRSYPGSDSRIQSGNVILTYCHNGQIKPRLVTSRSYISANIRHIDVLGLLPLPSRQVGYAVLETPS